MTPLSISDLNTTKLRRRGAPPWLKLRTEYPKSRPPSPASSINLCRLQIHSNCKARDHDLFTTDWQFGFKRLRHKFFQGRPRFPCKSYRCIGQPPPGMAGPRVLSLNSHDELAVTNIAVPVDEEKHYG